MESHSELHVLFEKLDDLWEEHLDLVDAYLEAQATMARLLSKGHFSLAQANFRSAYRGRYGQDYYDERMKASRLFQFKAAAHGRLELSIRDTKAKDVPSVTASLEKMSVETPKQLPTSKSTRTPEIEEPKAKSDDQDEADDTVKADTDQAPDCKQRDPLHWFGILVPQELRAAQKSFSAAMDGPVIDAVDIARRLRESEVEIGRVRKAIKRAEKGAIEGSGQAAQVV